MMYELENGAENKHERASKILTGAYINFPLTWQPFARGGGRHGYGAQAQPLVSLTSDSHSGCIILPLVVIYVGHRVQQ